MTMEKHLFKIPLYPAQVLLVRSTPKAFVQEIRRWDDNVTPARDTPPGDGQSFLMTHGTHRATITIYLRNNAVLTDPYWIGVLSHECWHGTCRLMDHLGMKPNPSNEEAFAYLHGWLMTQCSERIQRRRRVGRAGRRKK